LAGNDSLIAAQAAIEFCYISNPDGAIRWLFPKSLRSAMFLNFYSTSSIRSKILSFFIKLTYFLRISGLVNSGKLRIKIQRGSVLGKILNKYEYDSFSIFTGTIGENRKAIIELHKNRKTFVFIKIPITESSKELVKNEIETLNLLKSFEFNKMIVPKLLDRNENSIAELENIKPQKYKQNTKLNSSHIDALNELYANTYKSLCWKELGVLQFAKDNIESLIKKDGIGNKLFEREARFLIQKNLLLIEFIEESDKLVTTSISHGDFTPWNMYLSKEKLHLFDWELSENEMPLMYDLFHYVFQVNIMIRHRSYQEIQDALQNVLKMKNIQLMLKKYDIDFNKNYTFYLLYTISYYLNKYANQNKLHDQVFWMLKVWDVAISDLLNKKGIVFNEE
jgi:hypothetical protein